MIKIRARIYFKEGCDIDAIENICEGFDEADIFYAEPYIRFYGSPERLQELVRAIRTVENIKCIKQ